MNRVRRPPLQHPLAPVFERAVDSLCTALSPDTTRHYRGTVRNFLGYLAAHHPQVKRLDQLRRDPHILGWMSRLRSQTPPLATASCINLLIALRCLFNELAWSNEGSELAHLIRREDIPRTPQRLPRPLNAEQDQLLQQEFLRRNDLGGNAFLLIRSHRHAHRRVCRSVLRLPVAPPGPINGRFMSRSASSKPNAWSPSMLRVRTRPATSILSLPRPSASRWTAPGPPSQQRMRSFVNSAITCIRSVIHSTSPLASSRISFDTPMPRRCFEPVSAFPY